MILLYRLNYRLMLTMCATGIFLSSFFFSSCSDGNMKKKGEQAGSDTCGRLVCSPADKRNRKRTDSIADGEYVTRYPNGIIRMKGLYKNGKREGEWVAYFESGKVQSEGFFTAGNRDHHGIVYYDNGNKMYEGDYKDGIQVGKWKYYKEDGSLKEEVDYSKKSKKEGQ
ncbi:MAG TPA: hypothetical protein VNZ86_11020 [Bacteroidia bacterium]|jgi:antitoxin component YwqK of YwqJK toxin-antitoxin module|nr:hypothetical protein [Bacteroidia bacterium]